LRAFVNTQWTFGFHKMGNWVTQQLMVSQEGLSSMELVSYACDSQLVSSFQGYRLTFIGLHFSSLLCVLHAPPTSSFILLSWYLLNRTSSHYEASHYAVFSCLLLLTS
jgi:hypothetical protein